MNFIKITFLFAGIFLERGLLGGLRSRSHSSDCLYSECRLLPGDFKRTPSPAFSDFFAALASNQHALLPPPEPPMSSEEPTQQGVPQLPVMPYVGDTPEAERPVEGVVSTGVQIIDNKNGTYGCSLCPNKIFNNKIIAGYHRRDIHTNKDIHRCEICQKGFNRRCRLKRHIELHHNELFEKMFPKVPVLVSVYPAINTKVQIIDNKNGTYGCSLCPDKTFRNELAARWHRRNVHTNKNVHRCEICDKGFCRGCRLEKHIKRYHDKATDAEVEEDHSEIEIKIIRQNGKYRCEKSSELASESTPKRHNADLRQ